jgi:hypothetical protein
MGAVVEYRDLSGTVAIRLPATMMSALERRPHSIGDAASE